MNTYNDNLRSSVTGTLSALELEDKLLKAKKDAAEFRLYYAEGARITAQDKLDNVEKTYDYQQSVQTQGVINDNLAINVEASAKQSQTDVKNAVSSVATAAANVDVATKAIVKLSSDIGSILNIATAANLDTEIFQQCKNANDLISTTAYNAEVASDTALKSSQLISEISTDAVGKQAGATKSGIDEMCKITSAQFAATAKLRETDITNLSKARNDEKAKEGVLDDVDAEYNASVDSYDTSNTQLNQNLRITGLTNTGFNIQFDGFTLPFTPGDTSSFFPKTIVDSYNLMIVKASNRRLFNMSSAESAMLNKGNFIPLTPDMFKDKPNLPVDYIKITSYTVPVELSQLNDSDGKPLKLGTDYVVFLYTELDKSYKKLINNFEDTLSAASDSFVVTHQLIGPKNDAILYDDRKQYKWQNHTVSFAIPVSDSYTSDLLSDHKFEYRCIFLQNDPDVVNGLMNTEGEQSIEDQIKQMEAVAKTYDPIIADLTATLDRLEAEGLSYDQQIADMNQSIDNINKELIASHKRMQKATTIQERETIEKEIQQLNEDLGKAEGQLALANHAKAANKTEITSTQNLLKTNITSRDAALAEIEKLKNVTASIYFNLNIANEVSEANYLEASYDAKITKVSEVVEGTSVAWIESTSENVEGKDGKKKKKEQTIINVVFSLQDNTTDNFGNPIQKGSEYVPAILTACMATGDEKNDFTNSLVLSAKSYILEPIPIPITVLSASADKTK